MSITTDYGTWVNFGTGEVNIETNVAVALGEFTGDYDVPELVAEYRDAINIALNNAGTSVRLHGDVFIGEYPRDESVDIAEVVRLVDADFWTLAARFERKAV